jgi:hypothetical protein
LDQGSSEIRTTTSQQLKRISNLLIQRLPRRH